MTCVPTLTYSCSRRTLHKSLLCETICHNYLKGTLHHGISFAGTQDHSLLYQHNVCRSIKFLSGILVVVPAASCFVIETATEIVAVVLQQMIHLFFCKLLGILCRPSNVCCFVDLL